MLLGTYWKVDVLGMYCERYVHHMVDMLYEYYHMDSLNWCWSNHYHGYGFGCDYDHDSLQYWAEVAAHRMDFLELFSWDIMMQLKYFIWNVFFSFNLF